ncbi:MAG: hypothetical protein WC841_02390 [Candidatus Shapirobacteria bacterium]|jgi:hypothetical protein
METIILKDNPITTDSTLIRDKTYHPPGSIISVDPTTGLRREVASPAQDTENRRAFFRKK